MNKVSFLLAASALTAPALAQANDDCSGAIALTSGTSVAFDTSAATLSGAAFPCAAGGGPDLWYSYTSTSADIITIETCGSGYDTALELFSGDCNNLVPVACNDDSCGLQSSVTVTAPAANTTYFVRVGGFNGATGAGTIVANEGDPCALAADMFEDNDDCATATPLGDGVYPGLNVSEFDGDFYAVTLADGATIDVSIDFIHANGDCDLYLWDPAISCNSQVVGQGSAGGPLDLGYTTADTEVVTYTNTTGAAQNLIIEVDVWDQAASDCQDDYTLTITGASPTGPGPIGSQACPANPNSTGVPAVTTAFGEAAVAANNVTLTSSDLPNGQFGLYVTSTTLVPVIPVNDGNLCLGGDLGRYQDDILQSDINGEFSLTIDLTATPTLNQDVAVQVGETRFWQAWYRDSNAQGATSNFTSAVEITFQ